jgi:hypothetical protein
VAFVYHLCADDWLGMPFSRLLERRVVRILSSGSHRSQRSSTTVAPTRQTAVLARTHPLFLPRTSSSPSPC